MTIKICLTSMPEETKFVPLGVLGYCLTRTDIMSPLFASLELPIKKVDHAPAEKLLDVLVSILAGCRALYQVNSRIRPDRALARAWGREQFAEQANLSRTLDAFGPAQVAQLRAGSELLFRRESRTLRHDFAQERLWLDVDLTPLPASKHAQGSSKGKIGGKKTVMAVNSLGCMRRNTRKPCFHSYILVSNTAVRHIFLPCRPWSSLSISARARNSEPSCAPMPVLALMPTSTMLWPSTGRF